jgi:uncharacterized protein (TIGR03083 family)
MRTGVSTGFGAAVRAVTPDKWDAQSPCEQWKARDVVAHIVAGHRRVIAGVKGEQPEPLADDADIARACLGRQAYVTAASARLSPVIPATAALGDACSGQQAVR